MNNFKNLNAALDYVENRLDQEIILEDVARIAGCSLYNFQRMFSFLTETSFCEYVRKRKLSLAAIDLQQGGTQVNDVSCKYGYNSPTAFTRAFSIFHGITPNQAKKEKAILKVYPRITFSFSINGGSELDYRIETIDGFSVFGIEIVSPLDEDGFKAPAKLWHNCFENGKIENLLSKQTLTKSPFNENSQALYGIANYRETKSDHYPYMVCRLASENLDTSGYTNTYIPSQTYAVLKSDTFPTCDLVCAQKKAFEVQQKFYGEWLPTVNYEKTNGAELEIYYNDQQNSFLEIWYPITKK